MSHSSLPDPGSSSRADREPPDLGRLLMVLGGAGCIVGGLLVASGAEITVSATAARLLIQGIPLVGGGVLVVIGAAVRRAVRQARALGAAEGEGSSRALAGADRAAPIASGARDERGASARLARGEGPPGV